MNTQWKIFERTSRYIRIHDVKTGQVIAECNRAAGDKPSLLIEQAPDLLIELINARELIVEQCGIETDCELVIAMDKIISIATNNG